MIEVILLAGAVSVELEPYAVENPETDSHSQEMDANTSGRPFQWTTRQSKPDAPNNQGRSNLDNFGNRVDRDGSGEQVEVKE
jgi:hypothetical protein